MNTFRRKGKFENSPCCFGHGQKCSDCGYTIEEFNKKKEETFGDLFK